MSFYEKLNCVFVCDSMFLIPHDIIDSGFIHVNQFDTRGISQESRLKDWYNSTQGPPNKTRHHKFSEAKRRNSRGEKGEIYVYVYAPNMDRILPFKS